MTLRQSPHHARVLSSLRRRAFSLALPLLTAISLPLQAQQRTSSPKQQSQHPRAPQSKLTSLDVQAPQSSQPLTTTQQDSLDKASEYFYRAVLLIHSEQSQAAYDLLNHAYHLAPQDAAICYSFGSLSDQMGLREQGLHLMERAYQLDSTRRDFAQGLSTAYLSRERYEDALRIVRKLSEDAPEDDDLRYRLVQLYARTGQLQQAIDLCGELQKRFLRNQGAYNQITQLKVQLLQMQGKNPGEEYRLRTVYFPEDRSAFYDFALHLLRRGLGGKPFDKFVDSAQRQGSIKAADAVALRVHRAVQQRDFKLAEQLLASINEDNNLADTEKYLLWQLISSTELESEKLLQDKYIPYAAQLAARDSTPSELVRSYAQLLRYKERYDEAIALIAPLTKRYPTEPWLWDEYFADAVGIESDSLVNRVATEALQYVPTDWRYHLAAASELFAAGKRQEMLAALERAKEAIDPKTGLGAGRILGLLADLYATGSPEQRSRAGEYYEAAIEAYPSDAEVLNNYAYRLAKEGKELDKAERLAGQAVKLSPKSAHILDTYAYIYLKRGNYTLARLYARKALEEAGDKVSGDMYEHMGDILAAQQEWSEAERYWQLATESYQRQLAAPDLDPAQAPELRAALPSLKKKIHNAQKEIKRSQR